MILDSDGKPIEDIPAIIAAFGANNYISKEEQRSAHTVQITKPNDGPWRLELFFSDSRPQVSFNFSASASRWIRRGQR